MSTDSEKDKGNAAFRNGDYAAALQHYDNAIANAGCGACAALFSNKAATLHQLKNYDDCIQQCLKGLAATGLTLELKTKIYLRMGTAYEYQEKFREAMVAFEKCDRANPAKLQKMMDVIGKVAKSKPGGVNFWVIVCSRLLHQADSTAGGEDTTALTSPIEYLTSEQPGVGRKLSRSELIADQNRFVRVIKQILPTIGGEQLPLMLIDGVGSGHICTANPEDLTPAMIGSLRLDAVNVGKILICRTITESILLDPLITVVEDAAGEVSRLIFRNMRLRNDADANSVMPIGTYLAVMDPWYKRDTSDGQPILRADEPKDLLYLTQSHCLLQNLEWRIKEPDGCPDSWESFQKRGNQLFVAGSYQHAITAYSDAIELKRKVAPGELADLHSNRAAAYLADGMPTDAYGDCETALRLKPEHLKSLFRMAKASAVLSKYDEATEILRKSPHTTRLDFQAEMSRLNRLLREQQSGGYDLKSMLNEAAASQTPRLDHAEFNGGVEVQCISEAKGSGLVALRDFAPGDLLFVNKAFEAVYRSEGKLATRANISALPANDASQNECFFRIIQRISTNKDLTKEFSRLYAGRKFKRITDESITALDSARVAAIVLFNAIGEGDFDEVLIHDEHPGFDAARSGFVFGGCGIWLLASFINHSCSPNTARFFVGDIMFVRAAKRIRKGEELFSEELTISYASSVNDCQRRQQVLAAAGVFQCDCALCVCDMKRNTQYPHLDYEREAFMSALMTAFCRFSLDQTAPLNAGLVMLRNLVMDFSKRLALKDRYDYMLKNACSGLGACYHHDRQFLEAAEAFEMAYDAVVGNGASRDDTFGYNSAPRDACFLCFHVAYNSLLGQQYAKAREYLRKMQAFAEIVWGSADKELLKMLYPELNISLLFEAFP